MKWNPETRQYIDDDGNPVSPDEVRQWVDDYIDSNQAAIDGKTADLLAGAITVAAFFEFLRETITDMHANTGSLAYGGPDEMSEDQWVGISEKINSELAYLDSFEQQVEEAQTTAERIAMDVASRASTSPDVPAGLESVVEERVAAALIANSVSDAEEVAREAVEDALADSIGAEAAESVGEYSTENAFTDDRLENLIWGEVGSRARMYADAAYGTYENSVKAREGEAGAVGVRRVCENDQSSCDDCVEAASDEYVSMDEVTDIGETQCGSNCRCTFEFDYHGIEPLEIEREVYT